MKYCPVLSPPSNGKLVGNSYSLNDGIMAKCDEGYMVQDESSKFRFCQKDRTWSGKDAKCVGKELILIVFRYLSLSADLEVQYNKTEKSIVRYT